MDPYTGYFILPLTHDINVINEMRNRMRNVGPHNEMLKYDEFVFTDRATRKYKARDLWLTRETTDNRFSYETDGNTWAKGAVTFYFTCNDFSEL